MNFCIKHESRGRLRIHVKQYRMSFEQADTLLFYLQSQSFVTDAKVYERTCDAVIVYQGSRECLLTALREFSYAEVLVPAEILENSGRALNHEYEERLVGSIAFHHARKWLLPYPIRAAFTFCSALRYIKRGVECLLRRRIEVPVLDAAAITVSMARGDTATAGSVMFLLGVGELLEEWTHKKSVGDLARSMSLQIGNVWVQRGGQQMLVPASEVGVGELVIVRMGNIVPFDGTVAEGEALVNEASLTGESLPVRKSRNGSVYAGSVLEEGELTVLVREVGGASRYDKIVRMIEESEKLKSALESRAEHLADRLVPYSLAGTLLVWLLTRNTTKALAVLMVDFSCALKLAMPISVLSAIREAGACRITVKGGKYLEAVAEADTIVFDKTGTLTKARPTVAKVVSFNGEDPDELLRIAACMEEHFPHSMAKAVIQAAKDKGLDHEEMHSKVEYVVAHGISTMIGERKAIIGSYHFVFEDEGCTVPEERRADFERLPQEYSHLYLAIDNRLAAVICIEDPLREEAPEAVASLRKAGLSRIVMMTGDGERTAAAIARKVGVDAYFSEVLPEDKAAFVEKVKAEGGKVIMIGDGINDSPALSAADVGIAISNGAEIAREIADITIGADNLFQIVTLRKLSAALMKRIEKNYRSIVGINALLIALGVGGVLQPTASALLHNASTIAIGVKSMERLLDGEASEEDAAFSQN